VDFGGSLGSSYFSPAFSVAAGGLPLSVVEQKHFVDTGRRNFEDDHLLL
jgi:hypothetical protein